MKKIVEKSVESELRRTVRAGVEIGKVMMNSGPWGGEPKCAAGRGRSARCTVEIVGEECEMVRGVGVAPPNVSC